jgi:hypothetical protein
MSTAILSREKKIGYPEKKRRGKGPLGLFVLTNLIIMLFLRYIFYVNPALPLFGRMGKRNSVKIYLSGLKKANYSSF